MLRFIVALLVLMVFGLWSVPSAQAAHRGPIRRVLHRIHDRRHPQVTNVQDPSALSSFRTTFPATAARGDCGCSAGGVCQCGPSCSCGSSASVGYGGTGFAAAPPPTRVNTGRRVLFSGRGGGSCAGGSCGAR